MAADSAFSAPAPAAAAHWLKTHMSDGQGVSSSEEEDISNSPHSRASADTAFCAAQSPGHSHRLLARMRLRK